MKVPYTNFKMREGDTDAKGGCTFIGGSWVDLTSDEIFKDKKVVIFALPGAFTPTCSGQQLPGYEEKYDQIKDSLLLVYGAFYTVSEALKTHLLEHKKGNAI